MGDESETCFCCDRCPVKPFSVERDTWDPSQRSHPLTTSKEDSTSEHCSPVDSCSTTVKGYTLIYVLMHMDKSHILESSIMLDFNGWVGFKIG